MRRGIVRPEDVKPGTPVGQRQTRQRDAVLSVISDASGPLSVPEIHERAQARHIGIGIATIYRTLKLLQEGGQVQAVILPSGESRFETSEHGHHEHFQCRKCNQVFDVHTCPLNLPRNATLPGGFVVEDHELTLYGTCPDCVKH
jgi:Fur family transcriptional regulator, ferric uptake regulator